MISSKEPKEAAELIKGVSRRVGKVAGAKQIRSEISKARKALRSKKPDVEKAMAALERAIKLYGEDMTWRKKAVSELLPGLQAYEAKIRHTIGLRQQRSLPREKALEIAACNSDHRDISLHF